MANLDIVLWPPRIEAGRSVRKFDAAKGTYLGHMCLNTEVQPPQIEIHFEEAELETQEFPYTKGGATIRFFDDGNAMGMVNLAIDQAEAQHSKRFVRDDLAPEHDDLVTERTPVGNTIVHNSWFDDVVDG